MKHSFKSPVQDRFPSLNSETIDPPVLSVLWFVMWLYVCQLMPRTLEGLCSMTMAFSGYPYSYFYVLETVHWVGVIHEFSFYLSHNPDKFKYLDSFDQQLWSSSELFCDWHLQSSSGISATFLRSSFRHDDGNWREFPKKIEAVSRGKIHFFITELLATDNRIFQMGRATKCLPGIRE